jgi:dihydroorotase
MMLLIKHAFVVDENSPFNNTNCDILIDNNTIVAIEKELNNSQAKAIEHHNLHVSQGWCDLKANFGEPGNEDRETLHSGSMAAKAGGFTKVALSAATNPAIQSKSQVEYILSKSSELGIKLLPLGAATINQEGKQMTEMYDMFLAGAVGFTDDKNSIQNAQLFTSILQYANNFGAKIFHYACDNNLSYKTIGHEGIAALHNGFKGQPAIAEDVIVARDLAIASYYNVPVHFSTISSSGAVQLIRHAKANGTQVTCDVAAHQLFFCDEDVNGFDTNLKVLPPLRDKQHQQALIDGLIDGTIDAICSDHAPQTIENKKVEFDHAAYGMSSIETAFAMANSALQHKLSIHKIIEKFTTNPNHILNQTNQVIKVGAVANLTLFNPTQDFTCDVATMQSISKNNPLHGLELTGKVLGVVC